MPTLISPVDGLSDAFVAMATEFADKGEPRYMVEAKDFSAYLAALRERERGEGLPAGWVSDYSEGICQVMRMLREPQLGDGLDAIVVRRHRHSSSANPPCRPPSLPPPLRH
jgi:hypothetical protein